MSSNDGPFFDLASLAKPLVTTPLILSLLKEHLDDDFTEKLGFSSPINLTPRKLLSHSAGLPPWLPFSPGESLPSQLARGFPVGSHALLQAGTPGISQYSDLNFRILGEIVETETGLKVSELGREKGLVPAPWTDEQVPISIPDALDVEAWRIASDKDPPPQHPTLPHDTNARAGMSGHAG